MPTLSFTAGRSKDVAGIRRRVTGVYTGPASYATGGDPLSAGQLGLGTIEFLDFANPVSATPACRLVGYDNTNAKVIWFDLAGAEIGNGTDLSTFSCRFEAIGK